MEVQIVSTVGLVGAAEIIWRGNSQTESVSRDPEMRVLRPREKKKDLSETEKKPYPHRKEDHLVRTFFQPPGTPKIETKG